MSEASLIDSGFPEPLQLEEPLLTAGRGGRRQYARAEGRHENFPAAALSDVYRCKVTPDLVRAAILALQKKRTAPFSVFPDYVSVGADATNRSRVVIWAPV